MVMVGIYDEVCYEFGSGCVCFLKVKIQLWMLFLEFFEGVRVSVKKGVVVCGQWFWYNVMYWLCGGGYSKDGFGIYSGVFIFICENMWGK